MIDKILANLKSGLRKTCYLGAGSPLSKWMYPFLHWTAENGDSSKATRSSTAKYLLCYCDSFPSVSFIPLWLLSELKYFWKILESSAWGLHNIAFFVFLVDGLGTDLETDTPSSLRLISQFSTSKDHHDFDIAHEHRPVGMCWRPKTPSVELKGIPHACLLSPFVARFSLEYELTNSFGTHT